MATFSNAKVGDKVWDVHGNTHTINDLYYMNGELSGFFVGDCCHDALINLNGVFVYPMSFNFGKQIYTHPVKIVDARGCGNCNHKLCACCYRKRPHKFTNVFMADNWQPKEESK